VRYHIQGTQVLGFYVMDGYQWIFKHEDRGACEAVIKLLTEN